ncbi:EpsG family protein [Thalassobius sp. S69A]|uniref:EpsG family protein n=1 Tax=unclassified Thalassovita TaxID=2619711 RepID=UPI000C0FEFAF|nr:hypothetical protein [Paracoccaceae bacterium]MBT26141.1 hypothetical protein [Paracoccaceae bacterium]
MITYLTLFTTASVLGLSVSDRRNLAAMLGISLFLLWFMGSRVNVGCDFTGYYFRYVNTLPGLHLGEILSRQEPGFELLNGILKTIGAHYMWVNVCASALMIVGYFIFARAHINPVMIMALLFPVIIVQLGMSGIRQGIATAALMLASVSFLKGQRLTTALIILAGAQFHSSAYMFLPLAFLAGRRVNAMQIGAAVLLLSPLAIYLLSDRLDVYTDRYVDQTYGEVTSKGALVRYALIMIPQVFFLFYYKQLRAQFPQVYGLLKLFVIISFCLLPVAAYSSIALHRLNFYIMPFSILSFVYLSHAIAPKGRVLFTRMMPPLAYGLYQLFWFLTSSHAQNCYDPYNSFSLLIFAGG